MRSSDFYGLNSEQGLVPCELAGSCVIESFKVNPVSMKNIISFDSRVVCLHFFSSMSELKYGCFYQELFCLLKVGVPDLAWAIECPPLVWTSTPFNCLVNFFGSESNLTIDWSDGSSSSVSIPGDSSYHVRLGLHTEKQYGKRVCFPVLLKGLWHGQKWLHLFVDSEAYHEQMGPIPSSNGSLDIALFNAHT